MREMNSLTYTTREGAQWTLTDVVPDPHVRGFYWGRRQGDMHLLCVHEHRCVFHAPPALAAPEPCAGGSPLSPQPSHLPHV